jgi:Leucine-rich repeat (LRR) protein
MSDLTLTSLPGDLLAEIGRHIDNLPTYVAYISTCKKIRELVDVIPYTGPKFIIRDYKRFNTRKANKVLEDNTIIEIDRILNPGGAGKVLEGNTLVELDRVLHPSRINTIINADRLLLRRLSKPTIFSHGDIKRFSHIDISNQQHDDLHEYYGHAKTLILYNCREQSVIDFSNFSALETLVISATSHIINLICNEGQDHQSLEWGCHLMLIRCNNIQKLDISCTRISDVTPLRELKKLEMLIISDTLVNDVSMLPGLKVLDIRHQYMVDISKLYNLHTLVVSSTRIGDITTLSNLMLLVIYIPVPGSIRILNHCKTHPNTKTLYVRRKDISPNHFMSYDYGKFAIPL